MNQKKLSIIIPVYNEKGTILQLIGRVKSIKIDKEIIIVDDGSNDGTRDILKTINDGEIKILFHEINQGKGSAVRTAIKVISGEIVVIQDADMEYNPEDFYKMIEIFDKENLYALYGSRFLKNKHPKGMDIVHWLANKFYSIVVSLLYQQKITDVATCYKMIRSEIFKKIELHSMRFEFCPEITAGLINLGINIKETPIDFNGRTKKQGKKIGIKDAFSYLWAIIKYRFQYNKLISFLLFFLIISVILGGGLEIIRYGKIFFYGAPQPIIGEKFIPLIGKFYDEKFIGFIAENKTSQEDYWTDLFQLQNIIVPIIVKEGVSSKFIIALGYSRDSIKRLEKEKELKLEIINEFPNQVFLLKKIN